MTEDDDLSPAFPDKVATGLPGLDAVLQGGFIRGALYMFLAPPGSGKTICANQICFQHVASGGRAVYLTLLTESHSRMLSSVEQFSFFDRTQLGAGLSYVSGYTTLEQDKLKGLLALVRQTVSEQKASFLVIDGLVALGSLGESEIETKKFIHELQVFIELIGCTAVVLMGATEGSESYALHTMVDGLLHMRRDNVGMEVARTLEVAKFRGGDTLMGRHLFTISDAGVTIYPRTESWRGRARTPPTVSLTPPAAFGISGVDAMLGDGLRSGSITMVLGAPGSGKTLLGLNLLTAGANLGEPGLYFGFFENPAELCRRADSVGIDLSAHVQAGLVEIMWESPLVSLADELAERLLEAIRSRGFKRLFIDGIGGFKDSLVYAERSRLYFAALCSELRSLSVVTLLSEQTLHLSELEFPEHGLTAMLDTVIGLQRVERGPRVHKLISLLKEREGGGDPSSRGFSIGPQGFVVSEALPEDEPKGPAASRSRSATPKTPAGATKRNVKRRAPRR
jgi:circadian clock protein KaiC